MPLIKMETSVQLTDDMKTTLVSELSKIASEAIGKPEDYVMAMVSHSEISMAAQTGSAAFLDVRSIGGLNHSVKGSISKKVSDLLHEQLKIPTNRIYIVFTSVTRENWGYDGSTFG